MNHLDPNPFCLSSDLSMMLTCGFHYPFKDNNNLKLLTHEWALWEVEERALGINLVADGERRDEEELVGARSKPNVQLSLVQGQKLPLRCLPRLQ